MRLEPKIKMINIRLAASMAKKLETQAQKKDTTVTALIRELIVKSFGGGK